METKVRLQRVLQMLEGVECVDMLSDIERDIVLSELREAYAELKFAVKESEKTEKEETPIVPVIPAPIAEEIAEEKAEEKAEEDDEEECKEPEVEVELVFNEVENDESECDEEEPAAEKENEPVADSQPSTPETEPVFEVQNCATEEEKPSAIDIPLSTPKRSPLLSLYDDEPRPVLGEQFGEQQSLADSIAPSKGLADGTPIASLRSAIGVVDRYMLIRELFDGDDLAYERAIDTLEGMSSFEDCVIYVTENYAWRPHSQGTKTIMSLLQRKFENR